MCGSGPGGVDLAGIDTTHQAVIEGTVTEDGRPVAGYVRLLDVGGEFAGEVPTSTTGRFRFFAVPGEWTVRALVAAREPAERRVVAARGQVAEVALNL